MAAKKAKSKNALDILDRRTYRNDPQRMAGLEEARVDAEVARKLRELRLEAKLSQRALAKMVGTTASTICRLEDADYEGHSLGMLRRIAAALAQRVELHFVPVMAASGSRPRAQ